MRRIISTFFAVLLTAGSMTATLAQDSGGSVVCLPMAVATAPQVPGDPLPANEVVLTSVTGQEVARVPFEEPSQVFPTGYPERSLVRSLIGEYGVLAASEDGTDSGKLLALPNLDAAETLRHDAPSFVVPDGSRYVLINGITNLTAHLIDLETGLTLSLSEFVDEPDPIISGAISPGDGWATFWTGRDVLVVELSDDLSATPAGESLGYGDMLGAPSFSDDGSKLFFTRGESGERSEIVSRDMATDVETVIAEEDAWFGLQHFPGDILIVQTPGTLYRIASDGSGAEVLMESTSELRPRVIDGSGANILVEVRERNLDGWALVGLSGEGVTRLPELDESYLIHPNLQATWVVIVPEPGPSLAVEGARYYLVNLETGETQIALEQSGDGVFFAMAPNSDDGRFHIIWSTSIENSRFWLIDGEVGEAELVAESPGGTVGAVTPDGCHLAVGIFDAIGEGRQGIVRIIDLQTREAVIEIEDAILLGWARV